MANGEVQDKVILVTGATRGIGQASCEVLAREGAQVVVSSIEADRVETVVVDLPGGRDKHLPLGLDVSREEDIHQAFDAIQKRYARLDGLVNNAGVLIDKMFMETTRADWDRLMEVDMNSIFVLSQKAIDLFLQQGGGAIVNITSIHTQATLGGAAPYAAAKGGIAMFTKGLAVEFGDKNIRVNCVAPGLVKTEMWKVVCAPYKDEKTCLDHWTKNIPLKRIIQPEEIAETVCFMLSDRASAITGTTLYVDGGILSQLTASE